jgi:SAM-dependent methyltransferase
LRAGYLAKARLVTRAFVANSPFTLSLDVKQDWMDQVQKAWKAGELQRITLAGPRFRMKEVQQVNIRPVQLKEGVQLSFVYRHVAKDVTRNLSPEEGFTLITELIGTKFTHAYLQTPAGVAHLDYPVHRPPRIRYEKPVIRPPEPEPLAHDRAKQRRVEATRPWLNALGVTTPDGAVCKGMEAKFRQIHRFVELLDHLLADAALPADAPVRVVDMGCGKGYLTFAAYEHLRKGHGDVQVRGIETRPELVELTNRVAQESGFSGLEFVAGTIAGAPTAAADIVIALHACDTATDDALAAGVAAGARLLIVAPCCHKEVRLRLTPPPVLADALRHGILLQREAEFVTDALRAALLQWAGYDTKVIEFISPEHTSKNLMIAGVKRTRPHDQEAAAMRVRELAAFYGLREQHLAARLSFPLASGASPA